jgi:two-component system sensor histidine kinase/response regulator
MVLGNRYRFDVGLLDICMPGTSGIELAKQIKHERPLFPLIALSSADDVETKDFEYCLNKPLNRTQLFNAIFNVISKNSSHHAYIGTEDPLAIIGTSESPSNHFNNEANILVAEDIAYNQSMIVEMLHALGYVNITTADDGAQTIEKLKQSTRIDVLLLDLRMPVMDGYAVLDYIRASKNTIIKVIAVSASVITEDRDRCSDYGVKYFISKPIHLSTLKHVLLQITNMATGCRGNMPVSY